MTKIDGGARCICRLDVSAIRRRFLPSAAINDQRQLADATLSCPWFLQRIANTSRRSGTARTGSF
jgi:hypothetical protein